MPALSHAEWETRSAPSSDTRRRSVANAATGHRPLIWSGRASPSFEATPWLVLPTRQGSRLRAGLVSFPCRFDSVELGIGNGGSVVSRECLDHGLVPSRKNPIANHRLTPIDEHLDRRAIDEDAQRELAIHEPNGSMVPTGEGRVE